jgi:hypothetical protein
MPKCQFRWEIRRQFPINVRRGAANELRSRPTACLVVVVKLCLSCSVLQQKLPSLGCLITVVTFGTKPAFINVSMKLNQCTTFIGEMNRSEKCNQGTAPQYLLSGQF